VNACHRQIAQTISSTIQMTVATLNMTETAVAETNSAATERVAEDHGQRQPAEPDDRLPRMKPHLVVRRLGEQNQRPGKRSRKIREG
jgi:hypothetical protein